MPIFQQNDKMPQTLYNAGGMSVNTMVNSELRLAFPCAYPKLSGTAKFKQQPADFRVFENMAVDFTGQGEHLWLLIEKTNTNTNWLAGQIAQHFQLSKNQVHYSGLKDKQAVTTQWFSCQIPIKQDVEPLIASFHLPDVKILKYTRHLKKCQIATHKSNHFEIWLRDSSLSREQLIERLEHIRVNGVPNYFGPQRFGIDGQNIFHAKELLSKRAKKSKKQKELVFSALRSFLFNTVLAQRVTEHTWQTLLPGEAVQITGQKGFFNLEQAKEDKAVIIEKFNKGLYHPTGPLYGENDENVSGELAQFESECINRYPLFIELLSRARLIPARRALRIFAQNLEYQFQENEDCCLRFELPAGGYATSILKEIIT